MGGVMPLKRRFLWVFILSAIVAAFTLSACTVTGSSRAAATPTPEGTYAVDAVFVEFYRFLQGENTLGAAISPIFEHEGIKMQYTEAALMVYNPQETPENRYLLAPLGVEMSMSDDPIQVSDQAGARVVDGYVIYKDFLPLYDAMQGTRFVGRPLTQVRINYERGRVEQYFSNLGFYRLLDDPTGTVHLLAYGAWKCDHACRRSPVANAIVARTRTYPEPFVAQVAALGSSLTGRPLSEPYTASDGMLEQVYENLVVYADPQNLSEIHFRPLAEIAGLAPQQPALKMDDTRMVFHSQQDGLGHNVPTVFEDYIAAHGGFEVAGEPETELFAEGSLYRQCFRAYCLDYDIAAEGDARIRPAALGSRYLELNPRPNDEFEANTFTLRVWEEQPVISPSDSQLVHLEVLDRTTHNPIANLEAVITLTLPDGTTQTYNFQPTNAQGQSTLSIPAIDAQNGTLVVYRVCLNTGDETCVDEGYLIWGQP